MPTCLLHCDPNSSWMLHPSRLLGMASRTLVEQSCRALRQTVGFRLHDLEKVEMRFL